MKRPLKWLGILLAIPLLLVALLLVAVAGVAGTEGGVNFVAREAAERVEGLEIGPIEGHLGSGVATEAFSFENESIAIETMSAPTGRVAFLTFVHTGRETFAGRSVRAIRIEEGGRVTRTLYDRRTGAMLYSRVSAPSRPAVELVLAELADAAPPSE